MAKKQKANIGILIMTTEIADQGLQGNPFPMSQAWLPVPLCTIISLLAMSPITSATAEPRMLNVLSLWRYRSMSAKVCGGQRRCNTLDGQARRDVDASRGGGHM
jgi:hypothetical protein